MFKLLFKTTTFYVIWQKFKKHILLIISSLLLIFFIGIIYDDIFEFLKVSNKQSLGTLLFFKWFFIFVVIAFSIYTLKKTIKEEKEFKQKYEVKDTPTKTALEEKVLKKKDILSRSDLILKEYEKKYNK